MSATLGVVVNPTAAVGRAKRRCGRVVELLKERGHTVKDLSADDLVGATATVRQGVVSGMDALVVVGGDGMTHLGVNAVASTTLPLAIVAVGTGNDIARALGLPVNSIRKAVDVIDQALVTGPRLIDAVRVTDTSHSMGEWYAGVLSAGFDAAVNATTNRMRWPRGSTRYVRAVFHELSKFAPYGFRVEVDGEVWEQAGTLVSVANGPDIGGGMHIAPDASFDDGLLDVVLAAGLGRAQLLKVFPKVFRGTHVHHPAVTIRRGRVVTISPADLGQAPPEGYADGERIGPLPLRCEVVSGALRVLAPFPK